MKSGTTSLFDILGQHPEICPSRIKEPGFFVAERNRESLNEYLGLWDWNPAKHKYALESSVSYAQVPVIKGVPKRMAETKLGEYRFIYLMRNPITRIESQARHGIFAGWGKSLDDGIGQDLIDFSRYAMQMDEYRQFFPRDTILPVVLEEFIKNPHAVLRRVCDFLGIDRNYNFSNVDEPRNSGAFFQSSTLIRRLSQSRLGTLAIRELLPFRLKNWLRKKITGSGSSRKETKIGRWQLNEIEKSDIIRILMPDLKRLHFEYDIDIHGLWRVPKDTLN